MRLIDLIPPQYRIAAVVVYTVALLAAGSYSGWTIASWRWGERMAQWERNAEEAAKEASEAARAKEKDLLQQITDIEAQRHDEARNAEAERDRLLADIRAGQRRLRDRFTCPGNLPGVATGTAGGDAGAPAGLQRADAEFLVRLASEADAVTRQLQACQAILKAERPP